MTQQEKESVRRFRLRGKSCAAIASALGLSESAVKSFCRRDGLPDADTCKAVRQPAACKQCGKPLPERRKGKPREFCSDACRMIWWNRRRHLVFPKGTHALSCHACGRLFKSYDPKRKCCCRACYMQARFGGVHDKRTVEA